MTDTPRKNHENSTLDIAIIDLAQVIPVGKGQSFKTGMDLDELHVIEDGAIGIIGSDIVYVGNGPGLLRMCNIGTNTRILDGRGKIALPGFVDPHTHLIFSGTREHELEMKLKGRTYLEILESGGGILYTVKLTRKASRERLVEEAGCRLDRMLLHGTTTAEAKSGYGLDEETELRSLRVIRELDRTHPVDLVATFLGAHAVPPEFKGRPGEYIDHLIDDVLPRVERERLAEYCDVFLEKGVFGVEDSRRLLKAARERGLELKLHVDEIENQGGAKLACELQATSVEHLVKTSEDEIRELGLAKICCIFLPGTPFSLMDEHYPRAKKFIATGCIVALATDLNPNCMSENMQNVITLACYKMKMTPAQAISAATLNAAYGIGRSDRIGSLEAGKQADVIVLDLDDHRKIPYHFGINHVLHVIKKGNIEVFEGQMVRRARYVYIYAFRDGGIMMVRNIRRGGWEIPGGRVEEGESFREAAIREFKEETGHDLVIISSVEAEGGRVFFGEVGERTGDFRKDEIGECRLMKGLPDDLNYPEVEYLAYMRTAPQEIRPKWV